MNVWTHYVFWDGEYPKGPGDIVCRKSQQKKRNEIAAAYQELNLILDTGDYWWSCSLAVLNSTFNTNQVELNVNGFCSHYKYTYSYFKKRCRKKSKKFKTRPKGNMEFL